MTLEINGITIEIEGDIKNIRVVTPQQTAPQYPYWYNPNYLGWPYPVLPGVSDPVPIQPTITWGGNLQQLT